jgi:hypothetical protein
VAAACPWIQGPAAAAAAELFEFTSSQETHMKIKTKLRGGGVLVRDPGTRGCG